MTAEKIFFVILALLAKNTNAAQGMPQFDANTFPSQLFWLLVSFLILYICITFIVLPRIRENIRLRKNKIANDIERATNLRDQTEKIILEYDKKISESKNKANELVKKSSRKATADLHNQLSVLKNNIEKKIIATEIELDNYKKESMKNIDEYSNTISKVIMKKIFSDNMEKKDIDNLLLDKKELS